MISKAINVHVKLHVSKYESKVFTVHASKTYKGRRGIAPLILNLGARWRWWSVSRPGCFTPGYRSTDTDADADTHTDTDTGAHTDTDTDTDIVTDTYIVTDTDTDTVTDTDTDTEHVELQVTRILQDVLRRLSCGPVRAICLDCLTTVQRHR